jgi:hypothetical protein
VSQTAQIQEFHDQVQQDNKKGEESRRRGEHDAVLDWLHADSAKANLESHITSLSETANTTLRLMGSTEITSWLDTAPTSSNLLWITGAPGSGE